MDTGLGLEHRIRKWTWTCIVHEYGLAPGIRSGVGFGLGLDLDLVLNLDMGIAIIRKFTKACNSGELALTISNKKPEALLKC
jgi:hypothetical protein